MHSTYIQDLTWSENAVRGNCSDGMRYVREYSSSNYVVGRSVQRHCEPAFFEKEGGMGGGKGVKWK